MTPQRGKLYINHGEDDQMEVYGYERSIVKTSVTWVFIVLTAGLLRLFFFWLPHLMVRAMNKRCSLDRATVLVFRDEYKQWFVSHVHVVTKDGHPVNAGRVRSVSGGSNTPLADVEGAKKSNVIRYFVTKKIKYVWDTEYSHFIRLKGIEDNVTCNYFHDAACLSFNEVFRSRVLYGFNSIDIHVTPIIKLLFKEVLSPFYIFQIFSCTLWFVDEYMYYASCIVLISVLSITATIYQTRKMQRALRNTIQSSTIVTVIRNNNECMEINSDDLVPGDIIEIPRSGCLMQCDAVLVSGNCIVNESMLTGESVPVTKTPLPNPRFTHEDSKVYFNVKDHARHILYCGTQVMQTRYYGGHKVKAVVFRTAFSTAKGELVRSILYPKPVDFRFNRDTYIFVGILGVISVMGFIYTIILMVRRDNLVEDIIIRSLDLVTIAVPPALPAALTVGIVFAQSRLKRARIYCISPRSINVCGSINTVCFDKTGTLTEEGLDMHSIVPVHDGKFGLELSSVKMLPRGNMMVGMATCHSLTIIEGVLSGDPLELIMFESIGWELKEPGMEESSNFDTICPTIVYPKTEEPVGPVYHNLTSRFEIGIVRQFTFSSSLQRMSVIVRQLGSDHFDIYTKGAPEMVSSLCVTDTVPPDFHDVLMTYTRHGYRVLALAYKPLSDRLKYPKLQRIEREQVERGLTFLGLIIMENRLKPETTQVINQLNRANIRTIMVTGDNMLTALSVARESGFVKPTEPIILVQAFPPQTDAVGNVTETPHVEYVYTDAREDVEDNVNSMGIKDGGADIEKGQGRIYHFAVTGKSWAVLKEHFSELMSKIVVRGTIFARMSPDQKAQLVENLQDLGYYVGMCGDGANDCGALKTAHAGISLSEAEASVASPFTSKNANISCVPTVIREGRAALVTSFGIFKYMACYSLTQFLSVLILYWISNNLTDFEFLYIDLILLTSLSVTFGRTHAYGKLHRVPPLVKLTSVAPVLSLILHIIIMLAVQVFFLFYIKQASWFVAFVIDPEDEYNYISYENMAIYVSSTYQYIILAIIFSKGKPYRKSMFTNYAFLVNLIIVFGVTAWLNIYPTDAVAEFFELQMPPDVPYRFIFLGVGFINLLLCLLLETFVLDSHFMTVTVQNKLERILPGARPRYEEVESLLQANSTWPPVTSEDLASTFQRLDSAYQSRSTLNEMDNLSLSGSESGSIRLTASTGKQRTRLDNGILSGVDNPTYHGDEHSNESTRL
ncbi:polyamine-transporting ATPase 13A3-like isoform X1 [Dreissena polymorpha]|uniref:polyamine-transporting ATPase 13A3-like isoform X1 n=1 Tax=Dreissena polymorpha TaxID=45954 RepID=UPI00226528DA|nr:polyamine-transporting ATPase 13A3-like isoform X1 [Dreissena polymorpha]